jgi:hypothetical protein
MARETKALGSAECPVEGCDDDAYYRTKKSPQVVNYRCRTGKHWGHLRTDALVGLGIYIELEYWAEVFEDQPLQDELRRIGESMQ